MTGPADDATAVLATVIDRQSADLSLYAGFVANALAGALPPEHVHVERRAGLFGRVKDDAPVVAVSVQLGDRVYTVRRAHTGALPHAEVAHVVGGITLSTQPIPWPDWCRQVAAGLTELSRTNAEAAQALARFTGYQV